MRSYDFLYYGPGRVVGENSRGALTGDDVLEPIYIDDFAAWFRFKSDSTVGKSGFDIRWNATGTQSILIKYHVIHNQQYKILSKTINSFILKLIFICLFLLILIYAYY